jgi:hypothetical protein
VSIAYRLDSLHGLTVVVWDGVISGDEAEDHVRAMRGDPGWPPGPRHLLDATTARSVPTVANTKLVEMAAEAADTNRIRFAVVANRFADSAAAFQRRASAEGVQDVAVFADVSAASAWLGVDLRSVRTALGHVRRELRDRH